jgi:aerobic carbon-monoxide dehydrogenase large subunit
LPTIVNAVIDALAPLGVKQLDMPATGARIWAAMRRSASPR